MLTAKKIIVTGIVSCICVMIIGLLFYNNVFQIGTKDEIHQIDLSLVDLEKEFIAIDSPISSDYEPILKKMNRKAKEMLYLTSDQKVEQAAIVFFGYDLEDNYSCQFLYADDTIHITEFPEVYTPIVITKETLVRFVSKYKEQDLKFYIGDPREMHETGYSTVKPVSIGANNQLLFEQEQTSQQMILFTIVKAPGDLLYKKYVWVLKFVADSN
ncbi:MAG TPA: hypothetical protein PLZ08_04550 [Bacillota bacterium]|jgi:hypothetical protein|nr:hypothetical protein [Bacillota bacterium]HOL10210.1 hypothetical protein [Bacillota bacterium]HPO97212.1 hypothetical protein [Bacillota bacterium]